MTMSTLFHNNNRIHVQQLSVRPMLAASRTSASTKPGSERTGPEHGRITDRITDRITNRLTNRITDRITEKKKQGSKEKNPKKSNHL